MTLPWHTNISNYDQKWAIALRLADRVHNGQVIGAGSGSTAFLALKAIGARVKREGLDCAFIPTSKEIELTCVHFGLRLASLLSVDPVWCFDGADEVDPDGNMIKGRGAAMYQEKLVMQRSKERIILVDSSKNVSALGEKFAVPVEVSPVAIRIVGEALKLLGGTDVQLRVGSGKDGPIYTENGNIILDARFRDIDKTLEGRIKAITGVIESGLFWGYKPEIISN
jgi:ribose 5-phosphate isomerase A